MTIDPLTLAAAMDALLGTPGRLAAVEQGLARLEGKLEVLVAALPPVLVPITQAAAVFKVSVPTMRRWVRNGEVPIVKVGATVRVDLSRVHGADDLAVAREARSARAG